MEYPIEGNVTQTRRHRFAWNPEYDELAQDAAVVIGSRCRSIGRMDWSSMTQLFPSLDSNGVRQRLMRLREDPALEAYLLRLENAWNNFWMQKRGTSILPDNNPENIFEFDLLGHVACLRRHIDKGSL